MPRGEFRDSNMGPENSEGSDLDLTPETSESEQQNLKAVLGENIETTLNRPLERSGKKVSIGAGALLLAAVIGCGGGTSSPERPKGSGTTVVAQQEEHGKTLSEAEKAEVAEKEAKKKLEEDRRKLIAEKNTKIHEKERERLTADRDDKKKIKKEMDELINPAEGSRKEKEAAEAEKKRGERDKEEKMEKARKDIDAIQKELVKAKVDLLKEQKKEQSEKVISEKMSELLWEQSATPTVWQKEAFKIAKEAGSLKTPKKLDSGYIIDFENGSYEVPMGNLRYVLGVEEETKRATEKIDPMLVNSAYRASFNIKKIRIQEAIVNNGTEIKKGKTLEAADQIIKKKKEALDELVKKFRATLMKPKEYPKKEEFDKELEKRLASSGGYNDEKERIEKEIKNIQEASTQFKERAQELQEADIKGLESLIKGSKLTDEGLVAKFYFGPYGVCEMKKPELNKVIAGVGGVRLENDLIRQYYAERRLRLAPADVLLLEHKKNLDMAKVIFDHGKTIQARVTPEDKLAEVSRIEKGITDIKNNMNENGRIPTQDDIKKIEDQIKKLHEK